MEELQLILDQCLIHARHVRCLAPSYVKAVRNSCEHYFAESRVRSLEDCTFSSVEQWLLHGRLKRNWKPATFRSHHRNVGFLFRYLLKRKAIQIDPTVGIDLPKLAQTLPRGISAEQAEKLISAARFMKCTYTFERARNAALVALMLFTGLRRQEVANLRLEDVDIGAMRPGGMMDDGDCGRMAVFVRSGKGNKDRMVPVSTRLASILREYVEERFRLKRQCGAFFLTAQYDRPLTANGIRMILGRLKKKAGFDFSAHTLRHTFATLMLEGNCDLFTLSKMMGHSKITTTIYLASSSRLMASSMERHPLN